MEGVFIHVAGDLLGFIGVVIAGVLITACGWFLVHPIFTVFINLIILVSSAQLLWKVFHVLIEGTPGGLDLQSYSNDWRPLKVLRTFTNSCVANYHLVRRLQRSCVSESVGQRGVRPTPPTVPGNRTPEIRHIPRNHPTGGFSPVMCGEPLN